MSIFQKRHYVFIANAIRESKGTYYDKKNLAWCFVVALEEENEGFNREMFLKACGVN